MTEAVVLLLAAGLASCVAIGHVLLLRGMLRRLFGARTAYGAWLAVPLVTLAVLLPEYGGRHLALTDDLSAISSVPGLLLRQLAPRAEVATVVFWIWVGGALTAGALSILTQLRFTGSVGTLVVRNGLRYAHSPALGPLVVGLLRPIIVVPADFDARYTAEEQAVILAHERMHIRRGDLIANALCCLIRCLLWFNPLVHLAVDRFRHDQELACDAMTLAGPSCSAKVYAKAMLKTVALEVAPALSSAWQSPRSLQERVRSLGHRTLSARRRRCGHALNGVLLAALAIGVWGVRPAGVAGGISPVAPAASARAGVPAACPLLARARSVSNHGLASPRSPPYARTQ